MQGAARGRPNERHALAGARDFQLVAGDGEAAGHWVVENKRSGQSSPDALGWLIDGVLEDKQGCHGQGSKSSVHGGEGEDAGGRGLRRDDEKRQRLGDARAHCL